MKVVFFLVFFILLACNIFSFGRREKVSDSQNSPPNSAEIATTGNQPDTDKTMKILGQIQVYGSEPHTFAGIVAQDGIMYAIYPPSREDELRELQGHLIEFTVTLLDEPKGFGSLFLRGGTVTPLSWEIMP